jgi:SAM-dependent methyltransferase
MAHAWKACWVQALGGSNPPSSAGYSKGDNVPNQLALQLARFWRRILRKAASKSKNSLKNYVPYLNRREQHQVEFRKNKEAIRSGFVPERLVSFANQIPGKKILEIGSADGTLALELGRRGKEVVGLELTKYRHETAVWLREEWVKQGIPVQNVKFVRSSASNAQDYVFQAETLVLSRTLYHLGEEAFMLFEMACKSPTIKYVAILGNRVKERIFESGGSIPGLPGRYLKLSSLEGMSDFVQSFGFAVALAQEATNSRDPMVIASKQ